MRSTGTSPWKSSRTEPPIIFKFGTDFINFDACTLYMYRLGSFVRWTNHFDWNCTSWFLFLFLFYERQINGINEYENGWKYNIFSSARREKIRNQVIVSLKMIKTDKEHNVLIIISIQVRESCIYFGQAEK